MAPRYQISPPLVLVHVNSYQCKEQIKVLGGKWQPEDKGWKMPTQEAYNEALSICDNVDEETDNQSAYYTQFDEVPDLSDSPIPFKDNRDAKVRSGQKFILADTNHEWIVVSKQDTWGDGQFDIICESLNSSSERRLTEEEIRGYPWTGFDTAEARLRYDRRRKASITKQW